MGFFIVFFRRKTPEIGGFNHLTQQIKKK